MLSACQSSNQIHLNLQPAASLNVLNTEKKTYPVLVRVYQLSEEGAFTQASFQELWKNDAEVLGTTLLNRREIMLKPNEPQQVRFSKIPQAAFVAVVALFRSPDAESWRIIQPLNHSFSLVPNQVTLRFVGNHIEIL
jgi:type VI secretion system protein VasD